MATVTRKRQIRRMYIVESTYDDPWSEPVWTEHAREPRKEVADNILSALESRQSKHADEWVSWRVREDVA